MQAIEQVFAETAGFHVGDQIAIGGRDDAHIDLDRFAPADRLDFAFLQRAQQLHLRGGRQFADLIEEQRAAVGFGEFADMLLGRAGEGAFLMPEQNGFDEIVGDGAAIDGNKGFCAPLARAMDRARDDFLADAGFAFDQNRNGRGRRLSRRS